MCSSDLFPSHDNSPWFKNLATGKRLMTLLLTSGRNGNMSVHSIEVGTKHLPARAADEPEVPRVLENSDPRVNSKVLSKFGCIMNMEL